MKVLLFGGTGFIGRNLSEELLANGYQVFVVTRNRQTITKDLADKVQIIEWDNISVLPSVNGLQDADVVINLAGESLANHRWSDSVKEQIMDSRIRTTQAIVTAINNRIMQPKVLINASAVGYYGFRQNEEITEVGTTGQDFLAQVCQKWESEAYKVQSNLARVVTMRIGVVLGREGALARMKMPFRFYLGGKLGTGKQYISWIHINDLTRMIRFVIEHQELIGPINMTAPQPVTMGDFCSVLGEVMHKPCWLPVPEILLKIALGQMAEMLVYGQRVSPKKIRDAGFEFRFKELKSALEEVIVKERSRMK
ncbi:MAG: epimerase [Gracilibacter sp. BRH_c7a]|nr:MAG: epimerase [Gracilibacter sp. BRH_c7a]